MVRIWFSFQFAVASTLSSTIVNCPNLYLLLTYYGQHLKLQNASARAAHVARLPRAVVEAAAAAAARGAIVTTQEQELQLRLLPGQ